MLLPADGCTVVTTCIGSAIKNVTSLVGRCCKHHCNHHCTSMPWYLCILYQLLYECLSAPSLKLMTLCSWYSSRTISLRQSQWCSCCSSVSVHFISVVVWMLVCVVIRFHAFMFMIQQWFHYVDHNDDDDHDDDNDGDVWFPPACWSRSSWLSATLVQR